jgi:hypothetical protein
MPVLGFRKWFTVIVADHPPCIAPRCLLSYACLLNPAINIHSLCALHMLQVTEDQLKGVLQQMRVETELLQFASQYFSKLLLLYVRCRSLRTN